MGETVTVDALLRDPTTVEVTEGLERNPGSRRLADRGWQPLWFEVRIAIGDEHDHEFVHSLVWREPGRDARASQRRSWATRSTKRCATCATWRATTCGPRTSASRGCGSRSPGPKHLTGILRARASDGPTMMRMDDQPGEPERTELDELLASLGTARPLSEISVASSKVAAIVEAAERRRGSAVEDRGEGPRADRRG